MSEQTPPPTGLAPGDEVIVLVGAVAHGGHFVARHQGQVVFVRHTLPGERVLVRVTDVASRGRYVRAEVLEVLEESTDRVRPPCRFAGPGLCGGCDLQHVSLERQRSLKAEVVRELLWRLAGVDQDVVVEPVPGDDAGLAWRTRVEFAIDSSGRAGLRRHRSHEVVPVDQCLLAAPGVDALDVPWQRWPGVEAVDAVAPSVGSAVAVPVPVPEQGPPKVVEHVMAQWPTDRGRARFDRRFTLSARGFWQVHPGAAATFVATVMEMLQVRPGEAALDLYSGVGLFAAALGEAVGSTGQVVAVESDADAVRQAQAGLADLPWVLPVHARVDDAFGVPRPVKGSARGRRTPAPARSPLIPTHADVLVLDPPRTGAGGGVVRAVAALGPRAVAYVACDPAALARDVATFAEVGYTLQRLRAFDAFPMTHHLECVALLAPHANAQGPRRG